MSQGDVVAFVGMTGLATGPHLHFEYLVHGEQRNPQTAVKTAEATQLEAALRPQFDLQAAPLLASLSGTPLPAPPVVAAGPVTKPVAAAIAAR